MDFHDPGPLPTAASWDTEVRPPPLLGPRRQLSRPSASQDLCLGLPTESRLHRRAERAARAAPFRAARVIPHTCPAPPPLYLRRLASFPAGNQRHALCAVHRRGAPCRQAPHARVRGAGCGDAHLPAARQPGAPAACPACRVEFPGGRAAQRRCMRTSAPQARSPRVHPLQGRHLVLDWLPALVPLLGAAPRDVVLANFGEWRGLARSWAMGRGLPARPCRQQWQRRPAPPP